MRLHKLREELIHTESLEDFLTLTDIGKITIYQVNIRWMRTLLQSYATFRPGTDEVLQMFPDLTPALIAQIEAGGFYIIEKPLFTYWLLPGRTSDASP